MALAARSSAMRNQFVRPALALAAALSKKQSLWRGAIWPFGARLIHLFDDLEGQDDTADLAGLTVPDKFHLALVLEEQETKLVRQRLVGLDVSDDLLLLLFSQSWHETSLFPTSYLVSN